MLSKSHGSPRAEQEERKRGEEKKRGTIPRPIHRSRGRKDKGKKGLEKNGYLFETGPPTACNPELEEKKGGKRKGKELLVSILWFAMETRKKEKKERSLAFSKHRDREKKEGGEKKKQLAGPVELTP